MRKVRLLLADGEYIETDRDGNGSFTADWEEKLTERFQTRLFSQTPNPMVRKLPLMYPLSAPARDELLLRALYLACHGSGATLYVGDQDTNGRLQKVSATWLLDTFEHPVVALLLKEQGRLWALYHFPTHCAFESERWCIEPGGLLQTMQDRNGGYE